MVCDTRRCGGPVAADASGKCRRVACLSQLALSAVPWVNLPEDCFLHDLRTRYLHPSKRWYSQDGSHIYTWDGEHGGEVEVFDKRGRHLGVAHPITGETIKPAVRGRRIDV